MKRTKNFYKLYLFSLLCMLVAVVLIASHYPGKNLINYLFNDSLIKTDLFTGCIEKKFKCDITAYCPGPCCNSETVYRKGKKKYIDWSDRVAVGGFSISELHRMGIDIAAVDTRRIPFGSLIKYNSRIYLALDTGGAITGNKIDLSMKTHLETETFGRRKKQGITVYIPRDPGAVIRYIRDVVKKGRNDIDVLSHTDPGEVITF